MTQEYIMTQEELHNLQEVEIELMQEVDRICKKCNIHYNMVGGTMLGAIRHKGHIPWDDDADIGMLRSEYEKFRNACKTELNMEKYYFQEIRDTYGYRWGYGKLRKKRTKFVRFGQESMPYEQGIFIDLFPMNNVTDNKIMRKFHFLNCFLLRKFFWSKVGYKTEKKLFLRLLYRIMQLVPMQILNIWYWFLVKMASHHKTKLVRILMLPTPKGYYGYKREWFLNQSRYPFANISLTGARDYDGYLKCKYGEYMKLPPEELRQIHAISELDLGKNK